MKRIEFISPVAAIRGNMSGTQRLVYPLHDNKAFEGPDGSVNYARNYRPSFIGAKRKSDGACTFQIKRRTANHLTPKAKKAMADMGGVGAIYSALVRDKSAQVYIDAQLCYSAAVANGYEGSFRKYMFDYIKVALNDYLAEIVISNDGGSVIFNNPWVEGGHGFDLVVSADVMERFWALLATNTIAIYISGQKCIAHEGDTFGIIIESNYNIMGLSSEEIDGVNYTKKGDLFVQIYDVDEKEYVYCDVDFGLTEDELYIFTPNAPV